MSTAIILVPPAINVLVTGLFAGVILRQYFSRRRLHQLYWSIALCMAFVATVSYMVMLFVQPTSSAGILCFRIYYITGGALAPAWLGMGCIALSNKGLLNRLCFTLLLLLSLVATSFILDASIDMQKLAQVAGTPGTGILLPGPWLVTIILLNTLGLIAIVGVAIYSGWKLMQRQSNIGGLRTSHFLWANVLILTGAIFDGAAGSLARFLGLQSTFWLIMALGWLILFSGVLLTTRRPRASDAAALSQQAQSRSLETVQHKTAGPEHSLEAALAEDLSRIQEHFTALTANLHTLRVENERLKQELLSAQQRIEELEHRAKETSTIN
jgi:hypothetical protein